MPFVALGNNEVQTGTDGLLAVDLLEELGRLRESRALHTNKHSTVGFLRSVLAYGNGCCGNFVEELLKGRVLTGEVRDIGQVVWVLLLLEGVLRLGL